MQHLWLSQTAVLLRLWYRDLLAKCQEAAKSVRAAVAATAAAGASTSANAGSGGGGSGAIQGQIWRIGRFGRGIGYQIGDQLRKVHLGGRRRWLFLSVFILASATMQMSWPVRQQGKRHAATTLPASSFLAVQQRGDGDDSNGDARMVGDDEMPFADSRDWTSQRRRGGRAEGAWGAADREWGGKGGTEGQGENVTSRVGTQDWVGGLVGGGQVNVSGGLGANGTVGGGTNRSAEGAEVLLGRSADGPLGGKGTPTGGGELGGEVGRGGAGGARGVAEVGRYLGEYGGKGGAGGGGSGAGKGEGKVGMVGEGGSRGGGEKYEPVEGGNEKMSIGGQAGGGDAGGREAGNKSSSEGEPRSYGYWRAGGKGGEAGGLGSERRGGSLEGAGGNGGDGRRVDVRERYERDGRDKVAGRGWWGWGRSSWSGRGHKGERRGEKESGRGEDRGGGTRRAEEGEGRGGEGGRAWRDGLGEGSREAWARRERDGEAREEGESAGGEREAGVRREWGSRGSEGSSGGAASGRGPLGRDGLSHGVTQGPPEGGSSHTQGGAEQGRLGRDSRSGEHGGPRDERELWEERRRDQGAHGLGGGGPEEAGGGFSGARQGPGTFVESKEWGRGVAGNGSSAVVQRGGMGEMKGSALVDRGVEGAVVGRGGMGAPAAPATPTTLAAPGAPVGGQGGWSGSVVGRTGAAGVQAGELQGGKEGGGGRGAGGAVGGTGTGAGSDSVRGSVVGIGGGGGGGGGGAGGVVEGASSAEALYGASVQPDVHVVAEGLLPNRLQAVCVAHALTRASGLSVRLHWRQHMLLPPSATHTTTQPGTLSATATGKGTGVGPGGGAGTGAGAGVEGVGGVGAGFMAAAFEDLLMPLPGMTVDVHEEVVAQPGEQGKAGFAGMDAQAGMGGFKPPAGFVLQKLPMEAPACGPAPFHQRQHGPILLYLSSPAFHSHQLQECIQGIINATSACQLAAPLKTCYSQLAPAAPVEQLMANENMTRVRESTGVYFEGPTSSPVLYGGFLCPAPWVLNCSLHRLLHRMLHTPSATFTTASFFPSFSTVLSRALHPSRLPILLAASARRYTLCSFFRPPSLPIRPPQPSISEWNERRRSRQQQEGYFGEEGVVETWMDGGGEGGARGGGGEGGGGGGGERGRGGGSKAGGRPGVALDLGLSAVEKQRAASGFPSPTNSSRATAGARRRLLQAQKPRASGSKKVAGGKPGGVLEGGAAGAAGRKGKAFPLDVARQCDQLWLAELFTLGRARALLHLARSIESDFIASQAAAAEAAERLEAEANAVLAGIDVFLALYHNEGGDGHGGSGGGGGAGGAGAKGKGGSGGGGASRFALLPLIPSTAQAMSLFSKSTVAHQLIVDGEWGGWRLPNCTSFLFTHLSLPLLAPLHLSSNPFPLFPPSSLPSPGSSVRAWCLSTPPPCLSLLSSLPPSVPPGNYQSASTPCTVSSPRPLHELLVHTLSPFSPPSPAAPPSERLSAMYCFIPKVACTSWKVWFRTYHRLPNPASIDWAHAPGANGLPELWFAFNEAEALRALSDRRLFRFVFLRDPFARVASAYLDKHVAGGVGSKGRRASGSEERILKGRQQWNMLLFGRVPKLLMQLANPVSHLLSFRDFVYLIERVPKDWLEPHIAPQARLCGLHDIKYDFVGRLESLERDAAAVLHRLGDLPSYNLFSSPTSAASLADADAAADPATLALAMSAAAGAAGAAGNKAQLGVGQFHVTNAASKLLELMHLFSLSASTPPVQVMLPTHLPTLLLSDSQALL
ncbi:unnamed protein product [Closterium sp. Naga37s-1]|nr:unnamed protein product [Closterium sp. Naga37s-1]